MQAKLQGKGPAAPELILCSCEKELMLVLLDRGSLVASQIWAIQDRSTELLAPSIKQMLSLAGFRISDLARIGCVRGPGSFTGTRLVLATAQALRRGSRAKLAALDYLDALAATLVLNRELPAGVPLWILTHARRNLVHAKCYVSQGPDAPAMVQEDVRLLSCSKAVQEVRQTAEDKKTAVLVAGSALSRDPEIMQLITEAQSQGQDQDILLSSVRRPSIDALMLLHKHGDFKAEDIAPLYIRPCDAVENLPSLSERMGRNADQAVNALSRLLSRAPGDRVGMDE